MNTGSCMNKEKGGSGNCVFKFLLVFAAAAPGKLDSLRAFVMACMPRRVPGHNFSACVTVVHTLLSDNPCMSWYLRESHLTFSRFLSVFLSRGQKTLWY